MLRVNMKKSQKYEFPLRTKINKLLPSRLFMIILIMLSCSTCYATDYYSENQYIFKATHNENYIYKWSASSGNYQENDKDTFVWIAPDVNMPTEATISLSVTDVTCSCQSDLNKFIKVLPREEILKTEASSNSTNSTQINDSIELPKILIDNTENSKPVMPIGNSTKHDLPSENPENLTKSSDLTLDTLFGTDSQLLDLSENDTNIGPNIPENNSEQNIASNEQEVNLTALLQQKLDSDANQHDSLAKEPTTTEPSSQADPSQLFADHSDDAVDNAVAAKNPLGTERDNLDSDQNDPNTISDISTLSFSDGTIVDVVFEESSSGIDAAFVVLHEDDNGLSEKNSLTDGSYDVASLVNTTLIPESANNQTVNKVNQIETVETTPKIASNEPNPTDQNNHLSDATEVQPKSLENSENGKNQLDSADSSADKHNLIAALPDAAAISPGQVEAQPEPAAI